MGSDEQNHHESDQEDFAHPLPLCLGVNSVPLKERNLKRVYERDGVPQPKYNDQKGLSFEELAIDVFRKQAAQQSRDGDSGGDRRIVHKPPREPMRVEERDPSPNQNAVIRLEETKRN